MALAYVYCRVSGSTQASEDANGIPRQLDSCSRFAAENNIEIDGEPFIEAYTGTDLENRPQLRRMREQLMSGATKTVIIESLTRIARDLLVQESIIGDFRKHGITLLSATRGEEELCGNDPTRKFIRQVLGAVSEFERSVIVKRMQDGKRRARAAGRSIGGRHSYGRDPREVELVNRVFHLRRSGFNLVRITAVLEEEGFRTRKGTLLKPMQVSRILRGKVNV